MFLNWASLGLHLWTIEQQSFTCVQTQTDYVTAAGTIDALDFTRLASGIEYNLGPIGRGDYTSLPIKDTPGPATQYWIERVLPVPIIHLYPAPDNSTDQIIYYRIRQIQDFSAAAETPDLPVPWLDAICAGLAFRLAEKGFIKNAPNPAKRAELKTAAAEAYAAVSSNDRERVSMFVRPTTRARGR